MKQKTNARFKIFTCFQSPKTHWKTISGVRLKELKTWELRKRIVRFLVWFKEFVNPKTKET
uniref:Uncharacterized protein n=1 Tax=Cucumis melo TaxID=3656 RepID=A0A9I9E711_CUCME